MHEISRDVERMNVRHLYAELLWMSIAFSLEWFYLAVFAIRMGATPTHLAILTSGRALGLAIGAGLAHRWQRHFTNPIGALIAPIFVYRSLLYLSAVVVPFLPGARIEVFLAMTVLSSLPNGVAQGVFVGMLPLAMNKNTLARVVRIRSVLMNGTILLCMVFVGQVLEAIPQPQNYQLGFFVAFAVGMASLWHITRIKTPDIIRTAESQSKPVNVWAYAPFRRFMIVVVALNFSVFMAASLVQLRLVRELGASDAWIAAFGAFEMAAGALFTMVVGRLVIRFGVRRLIIATAAATGCHALILALTPTLPPYIAGTILFGAGWFSVNILLYGRLVDIVPPGDIAPFATTYQVLINSSLFAGPLVGVFLIENVMSIPAALLLIAGLRFGASFLAWAIRVEPAAAPQQIEAASPTQA